VVKLQDQPVARPGPESQGTPIVILRDDKPVLMPSVKGDLAPPVPPSPAPRKQYAVKLDPSAPRQEAASAPSLDVAPPPARYDRDAINIVVNPEQGSQPSRLPPERERQPAADAKRESRRIRVALDEESLMLTPGIPTIVPVNVVNVGARVDFLTV